MDQKNKYYQCGGNKTDDDPKTDNSEPSSSEPSGSSVAENIQLSAWLPMVITSVIFFVAFLALTGMSGNAFLNLLKPPSNSQGMSSKLWYLWTIIAGCLACGVSWGVSLGHFNKNVLSPNVRIENSEDCCKNQALQSFTYYSATITSFVCFIGCCLMFILWTSRKNKSLNQSQILLLIFACLLALLGTTTSTAIGYIRGEKCPLSDDEPCFKSEFERSMHMVMVGFTTVVITFVMWLIIYYLGRGAFKGLSKIKFSRSKAEINASNQSNQSNNGYPSAGDVEGVIKGQRKNGQQTGKVSEGNPGDLGRLITNLINFE